MTLYIYQLYLLLKFSDSNDFSNDKKSKEISDIGSIFFVPFIQISLQKIGFGITTTTPNITYIPTGLLAKAFWGLQKRKQRKKTPHYFDEENRCSQYLKLVWALKFKDILGRRLNRVLSVASRTLQVLCQLLAWTLRDHVVAVAKTHSEERKILKTARLRVEGVHRAPFATSFAN